MDKETVKKYKKEFDAWLDGAEIQFNNEAGNGWKDFIFGGDPSWNAPTKYRIKPEPIKLWTVVDGNGEPCSFTRKSRLSCELWIKEMTDRRSGAYEDYKPALFREVIE